jgi:N-dimethylarginine dimethylaminohydrolase
MSQQHQKQIKRAFEKGKLEEKKEELEFLIKVIENSLINLTFIGNSNKDKAEITHHLLEVVKVKIKQLQKEIGGMKC